MSPFWLLLAAGAAAIAWRVRGLGRWGRAFAGLVAIVLAVVGSGAIDLPSIEQIVDEVGGRLGRWTYLLVGVNAFLETGAFLGFVAPGETMVLFGGVLAGAGTIELGPLIVITWLSAFAGDVAAYAVGRRYGRDFLLRHGERVRIGEPQVQFVEGFFVRHGSMTIVLGRWVGVVRPLVPFLAGSSRLPVGRFLVADFVSAGLWSASLCVLGSVFWRNFDELTSLVGQALFVLATLIVVTLVVGLAITTRRSRARSALVERWIAERLEEGSVLGRPAAAVWALVTRLERHVPGHRRRGDASAAPATVADDVVGGPPPAEPRPTTPDSTE